MDLPIFVIDDHCTTQFAAEELARYLQLIGGLSCHIERREAYDPHQEKGFWLGVIEAFPDIPLPEVEDVQVDDAIAIRVAGVRGIITGNNPHSILLAVYRYLRELGCRWVRPGAEGEYLPSIDVAKTVVHLTETPSYRYRALDLAGALSYEFLLDVVAWGPKVGLNGFFLEYDTCYSVLNLWYSHRCNPKKTAKPFSQEDAETCRLGIIDAMRKRDLLYHAKGHGWVWEALGLPVEEFKNPLPGDLVQYVAQTNGERGVTKNGAGATNLCYGNPATRQRFTDRVVQYVTEHREADYIHVWLADGVNNHCECDICRTTRPADFYLQLMNEIDAALTARGLPARIVFVIYVDLLWPPEQFSIEHPDRFILMFAPFFRSYSTSFADLQYGDGLPELPPYRRNQLEFSREVKENVDFLLHWKQVFTGDAFDFDYQYWLSQYDDPSGLHRARVMHGDIQSLRRFGMNGLVGCYSLRSAYPIGLGLYAMGRALWDENVSFDTLVEEYFPAAFGLDWRLVHMYLEQLGRLCDPAYLRGEKEPVDAVAEAALAEVPRVVEAFIPIIAHHLASPHPCWAASWRYLRGHAEITIALARAFQARARGDFETGKRLFAETTELMLQYEDELFPVLDTWLFSIYLEERACPELVGV